MNPWGSDGDVGANGTPEGGPDETKEDWEVHESGKLGKTLFGNT